MTLNTRKDLPSLSHLSTAGHRQCELNLRLVGPSAPLRGGKAKAPSHPRAPALIQKCNHITQHSGWSNRVCKACEKGSLFFPWGALKSLKITWIAGLLDKEP
jgi:hypothetical protein